MAKETRTSITVTVFILLFLLNIFLQMLLSNEPVGRYFLEVFTNPLGIVNLLSGIILWFISYFFTPVAFYIIGIIIAMEFLILPLMIRYQYLTFKPNLFASILAALYVWLAFRIMLVIFG